MRAKSVLATLATVILTAGLAGCATPSTDTAPADTVTLTSTSTVTEPPGALQPQKMWEREHVLRDGRTVTCLYVTETGLDCDWNGAR